LKGQLWFLHATQLTENFTLSQLGFFIAVTNYELSIFVHCLKSAAQGIM
jgi:hypothetical protein